MTGLRITVKTKQMAIVEAKERDFAKVDKWMKSNQFNLVDWITVKGTGETSYIGERTLGEVKINLPKIGVTYLKPS